MKVLTQDKEKLCPALVDIARCLYFQSAVDKLAKIVILKKNSSLSKRDKLERNKYLRIWAGKSQVYTWE